MPTMRNISTIGNELVQVIQTIVCLIKRKKHIRKAGIKDLSNKEKVKCVQLHNHPRSVFVLLIRPLFSVFSLANQIHCSLIVANAMKITIIRQQDVTQYAFWGVKSPSGRVIFDNNFRAILLAILVLATTKLQLDWPLPMKTLASKAIVCSNREINELAN